jgi:hypothetical protein
MKNFKLEAHLLIFLMHIYKKYKIKIPLTKNKIFFGKISANNIDRIKNMFK